MFRKKILDTFYRKSEILFVLTDQVIVSAGNFLLTILILRYLGIKNFGLFSYLWFFLLFINSIQLSYIISPMLTNFPKQKITDVNLFYGGVFLQQLVFSFIMFFFTFLVLKFFGNFLSSFPIKDFYLSFSLLIVFTQIQQFLRRLLFGKSLYIRAIISDLCTYLLLICLIIYFNYLDKLNLETIFWFFTFSFLLGTVINLPIIFTLNYKLENTLESIKENWKIGRWMTLTSIVQWFSGNLWIINSGIILGPYMFGIIRACQTVTNFANLFFQSLENIIPKKTSKVFMKDKKKGMDIFLKKFALKGFIVVSIISIIIILFSKTILNFFYGNETAQFYKIIIYLALILPLTFLCYPTAYGLRTLGITQPIFISFLMSGAVALLGSNYIISHYKIIGLVTGLFLSQLIISTVQYVSYSYYLKKK